MTRWARYGLAIILPPIFAIAVFGNVLGLAFDLVWGREVAGVDWPLNIADVIIWIAAGWVIGWLAGWIAGRHAGAVALAAVAAPLAIPLAWGFAFHLDFGRIPTIMRYGEMSVMFGSLPAVIAGPVAVAAKRRGIGKSLEALAYACLPVAGVGGLALHIWVVALAWQMSGFMGAATTLSLPFVSEIYWLFEGWLAHRYFALLLTLRAALYVAWWVMIASLLVTAAKLRQRRDHPNFDAGGDPGGPLPPTDSPYLRPRQLPLESGADDLFPPKAPTICYAPARHPRAALEASRERLHKLTALSKESWLAPWRRKAILHLVRAQAAVVRGRERLVKSLN